MQRGGTQSPARDVRAAAAGTGDVAQVAREIDRRILLYLPDPEDFVTAVLVDIELDGRFSVVSCGHPAPMLSTATGRVDELEPDHSPPLGQAPLSLALDGLPASLRQLAGSALGDDLALLLACYDPVPEDVAAVHQPVMATK